MKEKQHSLPDQEGRTRVCKICAKDLPMTAFAVGKARVRYNSICRPCWAPIQREKDKGLTARFSNCKSQARTRSVKWLMTFEQWAPLAKSNCHYCGLEPNLYGRGLDRIERNGDYSPDNVVPSCGVCNHLRSSIFTVEENKLIGAVVREIKLARRAAGIPMPSTYEKKAGKNGARKYE